MKTILRHWIGRGWLLLCPLALAACSTAPKAPTVIKVPVPVDCEIEQVPETVLPQATADMNIHQLSAVALARLKLIAAENLRLRAANNNPCPGGVK